MADQPKPQGDSKSTSKPYDNPDGTFDPKAEGVGKPPKKATDGGSTPSGEHRSN